MSLWVVAVTKPHEERRAARHLTRMGYELYLPVTKTRLQRTVLLFPRYIFVAFIESWHSLLGVYGVRRLLLSGDHPAFVEQKWISDLQAMHDRQGCVKLPKKPRFYYGQSVRITQGPFTGMTGVYQGMPRRMREQVLLAALGMVTLASGNLVAN